jgi:hypothetical protein
LPFDESMGSLLGVGFWKCADLAPLGIAPKKARHGQRLGAGIFMDISGHRFLFAGYLALVLINQKPVPS